MEEIVSCCGIVCSDCEYYTFECRGCVAEEGHPFWCEPYNDGQTCKRYVCCVKEKHLAHCGQCGALPCAYYFVPDPRKSAAENELKLQKQLVCLRSLPA